MVMRLALALLLALTAYGGQAAGLKTELDRRELALGEPLLLTLTQAAAGDSLETLDTAPLTADFEVQARTLNRAGDSESLALTLYPLRTGRLAIPPLHTAAARSRPLSVTVAAAPVQFSLTTTPARPLQRQAVRLSLEIIDDGSLTWQRPLLPTRAGLHLRALGEEQSEVERNGLRLTAHRFHWALIPTAAGALDLNLPMLTAGKFGQTLRFPPPPAKLEISPAPAWLPTEAAIGRPQLRAAALPATWPLQRPLAWRIEVVGGFSETALRTLLQWQLAAHTGFNAYPPSIETLPPEDATSPLTRLAATLYLLPQASGEFSVPALALPYFDPASQRLEALQLPARKLTVFNPLQLQLRDFGLGLAALAVVLLAGWRMQRGLARYFAKRRGLARIARAADLPALIAAVKAYTPAPAARNAATLGIWRARMAVEHDTPALAELVTALEAAHYGQAGADLDSLKRLARGTLL